MKYIKLKKNYIDIFFNSRFSQKLPVEVPLPKLRRSSAMVHFLRAKT